MALYRAVIMEPQFFEKGAGDDHPLHVFLSLLGQFPHGRGHMLQNLFGALAHIRVQATGEHPGQVIRHATDVRRDGHIIVIEDDQNIGIHATSMIQGLEGHACGHRTIANNRDAFLFITPALAGKRHTQGGTDGGAGMADTKTVV